jgi:serine/threonine-protein kinase
MSLDQPTEYELLTPEEAAQIDAVCDRFERAWKETKAGGPVPCLASYVEQSHGSAREVLFRELTALERDCRQRYSLTVWGEEFKEFNAATDAPTNLAGSPLRSGTDVPARRRTGWPSIPGLELVDFLGSGGMGVVYKARQATLDRDVAVKLLRDPHLAEPAHRERFLQEARAVARLRHPHLVQVYEFGEVPAAGGATSQPYLVLEYVPGGSLADFLRGSPQPPVEAARLVETVADAIHYAHQQGVIHRDLKPGNILLQRAEVKGEEQTERVRAKFEVDTIVLTPAAKGEGQAEEARGARSSPPRSLTADLCPKVTDFGLAKFVGSDLTRSGDVLGTPSYMAPEQTSKPGPITAAVDVYGLGAILYEALTGRPPFAAATDVATLVQVRQDEPVPPRRLQPTVPRDLETICLKCLRKEVGRRYATAKDLADDLRRFRTGEPIRARPVGTAERVVRWCRRKPAVAGLLAALLLVFLAGLVGVLWQWQRATDSAAKAEEDRDIAQQQRELAEHRLVILRQRVDGLTRRGRDLLGQPGQHAAGKALLEEALTLYEALLPEAGPDPSVRRKAAELFGQVAWIQHTLGQPSKAAEAWGRQARLVTGLLEEEPGNKELRLGLADIHRWRGNMLRGIGKAPEAREAYDQAAELHEGLLLEFPNEPGYKVALANTLLNTARTFSRRDQAEVWEPVYRRIVDLDRAAVSTAPETPLYDAELALALHAQGLFFLDLRRRSEGEAALQDALEIHKRLIARGQMKGTVERYAARNFVDVGRVLAAAGQVEDAEKSYREAVSLLDRTVKELPRSVHDREELAQTLTVLADFLKDPARRQEAKDIRRDVILHYETLRAASPEDLKYPPRLIRSYLKLNSLLWDLGLQREAAEALRKALEVDPENPAVNNELAWLLATSPELGLRDPATAVRLAQKAVEAERKSGNFWNTLGVAHYRYGDVKAAIDELETAMSLRGGGDSFDWFFLAMAHWRLGEHDKAKTWFDRAVQWLDKHRPNDDQLRRFRAEAETILAETPKP